MRTRPKTMSQARRTFLGAAAATVGLLTTRWLRRAVAQPPGEASPEDRKRIEAAIPIQAFVRPRKPRRLLIFDLNVGYGGHGSIPTANTAFTLMGARTGAFETVVSRNPVVFESESLKQFDAVFFNNTVGNCFDDPTLRRNLVEFVYSGGGLMGVHGTSVAFTKWPGAIEDWPEFGIMIGARGANHYESDEHVFITLDDPAHPIVQPFGGDFDYRDEFFRVHEPYSRERVRVLLSIDMDKTTVESQPRGNTLRADNDYALAWVRGYGRGRVFYCGFAHNPYIFWDPKMLQFYLAATQFALGDLPAPTTPSARLTPAIHAQEQLGWRVCLTPAPSAGLTLFENIEKAAELGVLYIGGCNRQKVSRDIAKDFDDQLTSGVLEQIRLKLDSAGVRLLTYRTDPFPSDPMEQRKVFDFARRMGADMSVSDEEQLRMDPSLRESAPLDKAAIETMEAMEKEGRSGLDKLLHRGPSNPVTFSVELAGNGVDSMARAAHHIELFNNLALKTADRGGL